ncbi:IS3 family transposase [Paenibacillus woosongensis]|uniref:IS3 family transposase n=1 Tax=Paenibacillus woosongensis TaxID=307580 RepID=A0AA95I7T8_9BACL|nr:IS3 family transposase [Paenibacillus woosongensis]WHX49069.1 IS3 family transposase [Paenibacillus woosongensis]
MPPKKGQTFAKYSEETKKEVVRLRTEENWSLHLEKPKSFGEAQELIAQYIDYYNHERFQKKLGDRSPVEYRETIAA